MASGDIVVQVLREMPPGSTGASPVRMTGGSTPAEGVLGYAFDAATDEFYDFLCRLEGYGAGGLTFEMVSSAASATTGNVIAGVAVRRFADDVEDLDSSHTYDFNTATIGAPSAVGEVTYDTIAFTDGADMDSWAEGELAIVRVTRDANNGSDTMAGDWHLWDIVGRET